MKLNTIIELGKKYAKPIAGVATGATLIAMSVLNARNRNDDADYDGYDEEEAEAYETEPRDEDLDTDSPTETSDEEA